MIKYSFFRNRVEGSEPVNDVDAPVISITPVLANVNLGNVINFNISANRTTQPTYYWTLQGNVTTGDFIDSEGLSGSIKLDATGNATITKELVQIGNANVDFYMDLRTGSPATPIKATSNTVFTTDVTTMTVTGGDSIITVDEFYTAHRFNASANINIIDLGDSANFYSILANVEYMAVAGGGGGGYVENTGFTSGGNTYVSVSSGGGGAGGQVEISSNIVSLSNYSITIGSGGTGGIKNTYTAPTNGGNTSIFNTTAIGGSKGGSVRRIGVTPYTLDTALLNGGSGYNGGGGAGNYLVNIANTTPVSGYSNPLITLGSAGTGSNWSGGTGSIKTTSVTYDLDYLVGAGGGAGSNKSDGNGRSALSQTLSISSIGYSQVFSAGGLGGAGYSTDILGSSLQYGMGGGAGGGYYFQPSVGDRYSLGGYGGTLTRDSGAGAGYGNNGKPTSPNLGLAFDNWPKNPVTGTAGLVNTGSGGGGGSHGDGFVSVFDGQDGSNGTVVVKYISSFRKATI